MKLKGNSWLSYCAALLTITTLAFGTFTQQLLTFKRFPVLAGPLMPGSVPHVEEWQSYFGRPAEGRM